MHVHNFFSSLLFCFVRVDLRRRNVIQWNFIFSFNSCYFLSFVLSFCLWMKLKINNRMNTINLFMRADKVHVARFSIEKWKNENCNICARLLLICFDQRKYFLHFFSASTLSNDSRAIDFTFHENETKESIDCLSLILDKAVKKWKNCI